MFESIFFIIDKTNALLKATGWETLTVSAQVNPVEMVVKIMARLSGEAIGTTQLPDRLFTDDSVIEQNKMVVRLHNFAVESYDHYTNAKYLE